MPSLLHIKPLKLTKPQWVQILVVFAFFAVYLGVGFSLYQDYGISTDEPIDYERGVINYTRLRGGSLENFEKLCGAYTTLCDYPPFFSMVLYRVAPEGDWQDILHTRHLITFLFFAFSVFVFYLIGTKIFKNWKLGLLGSLFLILSPRLFANSFYNPKDIPFLAAYVIAIYTLLLFIEKKNWWTAILHGVAVGMAISIRIPGLILLPITGLFYLADLFLSKQLTWKSFFRMVGLGVLCGVACVAFIYCFFPNLYPDPINNFIASYKVMSEFPWSNYHLYLGKDIENVIPWHYSLVWFTIGSPIFYSILFWVGAVIIAVRTLRSRGKAAFLEHLPIYLVGACGVLPILSVILTHSVIYTDNRQMYFCYPALLLVSLYGFNALVEKLRQKTIRWQVVTAAILVLGLAYPVYFIARYHPFENVYFNFLAGSKMSVVKERFGFDGWSLSNKQGLEYLLETIPEGKIRVSSFEARDFNNWDFKTLSPEQRERFIIDDENPEYILTTYRYYPRDQVEVGEEYYSIMVGDAAVMTIYKVTP